MNRNPKPHDVLAAILLLQRMLERRSDLFFSEYGLTDAQFNILNLLATHGGSMDQLVLIERLLVGKSSTSIVLNRMAKAGLIERREHHRDRRQSVLSLAPKGRKIWSKASPIYEQGVREIFGGLPKARRQAFIDDLGTLYAGLQAQTPDSGTHTLKEIVNQLHAAS